MENFKKLDHNAATHILGNKTKNNNTEWFDEECRRMIDLKNEARKNCLLKNPSR